MTVLRTNDAIAQVAAEIMSKITVKTRKVVIDYYDFSSDEDCGSEIPIEFVTKDRLISELDFSKSRSEYQGYILA